ncbi:MAG: ParB/RepB/Spo0J family partition protein [Marinovum sp.]|nr:ParB/RepB/Spo0J family partition protein [Marinovum sp.]
MAKRRKLTAPSAEDLGKLDVEFRRETSPRNTPIAPIAQVAADAALVTNPLPSETREKIAEAEAFQEAKEQGLVITRIPLEQIHAEEVFRDRTVLSRDELEELKNSILLNGLRLPIEVFQLPEPKGEYRYGLISGYRRLLAMREIITAYPVDDYQKIKAIIRPPKTSAQRFAAVIEENEVRASLCHYERGRFAAMTASNGVFNGVEDAVKQLFPFASKSKRSKIRSFALIFEELGDMLHHAEFLTEKQGLRIAAALREGAENPVRDALAQAVVTNAKDEWEVIEEIVLQYEARDKDSSRGGRPPKAKKPGRTKKIETSAGITLEWHGDGQGRYTLNLDGPGLDRDIMDSLMLQIQNWLGR